jgi:hypothetical protein
MLLTFFVSQAAMADDLVLQVWQANGKVLNISLNEEPRTTYSDGQLIITTTKTTVTFPLEEVVKYTYTDATGISSPSAMGSEFSADGESITFTGLKPNTPVYLYTVAGQLVKTVTATGQSKTVVSVSKFPVGVYVVKANGVTFKITKR